MLQTMPDENTAEKTLSWTLRDGGREVRLSGMQYLRKFDEPNRMVVVRSSLLTLATAGVKFRDRTWTVVSLSPDDPAHKCVVRYCYRLYVESEGSAFFNAGDLNSLRQLVSTKVVACMGAHVQMVQQALVR